VRGSGLRTHILANVYLNAGARTQVSLSYMVRGISQRRATICGAKCRIVRPDPGRSREDGSAVDVLAMPNPHHEDEQLIISD